MGYTRRPTLSQAGGSDSRPAGLIAAIFTVSYVAFSIPVVVAGVATTHFGLHRTALVYCTVIAGTAPAYRCPSSCVT